MRCSSSVLRTDHVNLGENVSSPIAIEEADVGVLADLVILENKFKLKNSLKSSSKI